MVNEMITEKKKAEIASVEWNHAIERKPRKIRPTQRYGIDVVMKVGDNEKMKAEQKESETEKTLKHHKPFEKSCNLK